METRTYLTISSDNRREALRAAGKLPNGENALEYDRSQKLWFAKPEADLEKLKAWLPENTVTGNVETRGNNLTPAEEFALALSTAGFILPDNGLPEMDGKRHRVATEGDKHGSKSGVYQGYMDGRPAGWYENHRSSEGKQNWVSTGNYTFDPALAMQQRAQQAQKRWDREVEQQAGFARMSENLTHQWSKMPAASHTHPYLARKGVPAAEGVRLDKYGNLVIPLRNTEGAIRSLQYIKPDGTKNLKKDAEKTGNFFVVGGELLPGQPVLYAEGYATAASLHLATGSPVVMTVDAGNMVTVSQNLQVRYPDVPHIILGEDDFTKKDNKGTAKAREAAEKIGGTYLIPTFTDDERAQAFAGTASFSDFNDIHHSRGLDAVRDQLAPVLDPLIPDWRQSLSEEKRMDTSQVPPTDADDLQPKPEFYEMYAESLQQDLREPAPVPLTAAEVPAAPSLPSQEAGSEPEMPAIPPTDAEIVPEITVSPPSGADIRPEVAVSQPSDAETGPDVATSPLTEPEAARSVLPVPETLPEEDVSQPPMPNVEEIPVRPPESAPEEEKPAPEIVPEEPQASKVKPESEVPEPEEIPVRSPESAAEEEQPVPETAAEEPQAAKANPVREGEEPEEDAIVVGPPRPAGTKAEAAIPNVDKDALLARLTWEAQDNETVLYKLDGEPAFVDHGTRLAMADGASDSDEKVLAALLTAAQYYRGRIELTGSEAFKAKAIGLIARHELNVSMKSPAQQAMLESARREMNKTPVEDDAVRGDMTPDAPPMASPSSSDVPPTHAPDTQQAKQPEAGPEIMPPAGQPAGEHDAPRQAGPGTAPSAYKTPKKPEVPREADGGNDPSVHQSYQKAKNGVMGKVISCGAAPFRFDDNNAQSVHIKLRTKAGIQTFWGKELAGLLRETRIQPGRVVSLKWEGKEAVTIQKPLKNKEGVITGYEPKQAHRNQWTLTPVGSEAVRSGTDEGVKLSAVDAMRFAQIQASVINTLGIDMPPFSQPSDGLFWLRPDGQGSQTPGDALSAPRPSPDRQAGKVIMSRSAADGKLDMCLVQSDGPYLQGVVRHQGEYRHVLVSLPDNKDAPPMVINMVTPAGIVPIGCGNGINRSDGQPVPREHLAFRLEGDKAVRIGKLDSPADVPPALHARLGFDERWREDVASPKPAPAAAPRPDDVRPA